MTAHFSSLSEEEQAPFNVQAEQDKVRADKESTAFALQTTKKTTKKNKNKNKNKNKKELFKEAAAPKFPIVDSEEQDEEIEALHKQVVQPFEGAAAPGFPVPIVGSEEQDEEIDYDSCEDEEEDLQNFYNDSLIDILIEQILELEQEDEFKDAAITELKKEIDEFNDAAAPKFSIVDSEEQDEDIEVLHKQVVQTFEDAAALPLRLRKRLTRKLLATLTRR